MDRASNRRGSARTRVDLRTLNRTLLARQWLHPRVDATAREAIEQVVGLQAQDPKTPYPGLWSRLTSFAPDDLSTLLLAREAVRIVTMRGTIHLHTAADGLPVRRWTHAVNVNALRTSRKHAWPLVDHDELVAETRRLLQDAPVPADELGRLLARRWPDVTPADLQQFARAFLPMVQVPPRGVWGRSGRTTYAVAEDWLGGPAPEPDPTVLIARYLAAFGPASVRDVQTWSGVSRLAEVTATMDLRRYVDDDGVELLDVDLPLVDPDTPVPPVFVAPFDNLTLSHADRRRVVDSTGRQAISSKNGIVPGLVLVDGFAAASWRVEGATLQVTPFERISKRTAASFTRPGRRLLEFLTGATGATGDVQVLPPDAGGA